MPRAVRISAFALRGVWFLNLLLGIYSAYIASGNTRGWELAHILVGMLVIMLFWFLGVAQALVRGGSFGLLVGTFLLGGFVAIVGLSQVVVTGGAGLVILQILHIILILSVIALGEMCYARYRRSIAS